MYLKILGTTTTQKSTTSLESVRTSEDKNKRGSMLASSIKDLLGKNDDTVYHFRKILKTRKTSHQPQRKTGPIDIYSLPSTRLFGSIQTKTPNISTSQLRTCSFRKPIQKPHRVQYPKRQFRIFRYVVEHKITILRSV